MATHLRILPRHIFHPTSHKDVSGNSSKALARPENA